MRVLRTAGIGSARAKNLGMRETTGRYLAFLDADDLWERNKVETHVSVMESSDVDVTFSRSRLIDEHGANLLCQSDGFAAFTTSSRCCATMSLETALQLSPGEAPFRQADSTKPALRASTTTCGFESHTHAAGMCFVFPKC
jgi:hypothetical protein